MRNAVFERRLASAAKSLGVDISDDMAYDLAKGFLNPLVESNQPADIIRKARPIWYLYEKALEELRLATGQVPKK